MININRAEKTENYTIISNAVLQNADLSLEARGALCSLISLPTDWIIIKKHLRRMFNCGMDKINSVFDELKDAGYLIQVMDADGKPAVQRDENGRFLGHIYKVYENPADAPATSTPPQASPPEQSAAAQSCGFRRRVTGGRFTRAGATRGGSPATANPQLQSTYKATKNTKDKEHREQNKQTNKHAAGITPPAAQRGDDDVGESLADSGEFDLGDIPDREGIDAVQVVKEGREGYEQTKHLLRLWGRFTPRNDLAQYKPERVAGWMMHVAECKAKPNHGIRNEHGLLASYITGTETPPPSSATPPSPEYGWLWDEATDLGIITPPDDEQPTPAHNTLPAWMQRKPQPAGDLPAHVTDTITVCKSLLEAEYDLATYNTYLRDVQCAAYDEATHTYTLTTSRTTSHDMLEQRLHTKIERTLSTVAGHPVTVTWQRWQDAITDTKQPAAIA